jgi:N-methylhydantoinase A/oxoprolinase/acetone carboxylase beta subunit
MIIGLDVGGTHTDVVLLEKKGLVRKIKVPTDSNDLFGTVLSGLTDITEGISPDDIRRIVLSTTLTTNAIVQKKIPAVGMIVSAGPGIDPMAFRTNDHYHLVSGSIDHRGREREKVDENEIENIAQAFKKESIRYVGVTGKFSTRNPAHEIQIGRTIETQFEKVLLGHQMSGNLNFPRRIATTYLNTAVYPVHKEFFAAVKKSLDAKGLTVPIHILKADGGTLSFDASIHYPGQTILSGPAASVMGSMVFAPEEGAVIVLDIGGTTTDIAVLIDRSPVLDPLGIRLGDYRTLIRSLKTRSIGLGGDSVVQVRNGKMEVGPHRNGPAMAFGGSDPTPTDALVVLGELTSGDGEKAAAGVRIIADALRISLEETAQKIVHHVCHEIISETRNLIRRINRKPVYTIQALREDYDVNPRQILVLGGPADHFAPHLERISPYRAKAVPSFEVANAVGAALARTTCEVTLFADTEIKEATVPEEDYYERVSMGFGEADAIDCAKNLLSQKALRSGAGIEDLEMEIVESLQFNMVRGFTTTGKNIRVKVQVKPGLIKGSKAVVDSLNPDRA